MKKSHQIIFVGLVIATFVAIAVWVYFAEGVDMRNTHYIRIELNPKVEFLTSDNNVVKTIYPVNMEAEMVVAGEEFVGLDITDAVTKFLDLCAKMGYIEVDSMDNAVQISVSSSFTQSLENRVYMACNKFFVENEIFGIIAESDADRKLYEESVENKVSSIEKLVVIKAVMEKTQDYTFEKLRDMTESDLMQILESEHDKIQDKLGNNFADYIDTKNDRLQTNQAKYDTHKKAITIESTRQFVDKYAKFKKSNTAEWELDFQSKIMQRK